MRANKGLTLDYLKLTGYCLAALSVPLSCFCCLECLIVNTLCWPFRYTSSGRQADHHVNHCRRLQRRRGFHPLPFSHQTTAPGSRSSAQTAQQTFCGFSGRCLEQPPILAPSAPPIHHKASAPHHTQSAVTGLAHPQPPHSTLPTKSAPPNLQAHSTSPKIHTPYNHRPALTSLSALSTCIYTSHHRGRSSPPIPSETSLYLFKLATTRAEGHQSPWTLDTQVAMRQTSRRWMRSVHSVVLRQLQQASVC